jgi:hypothetical protein
MDTETWVPDEISMDKPNVARVYDYFLGGYHNFEADRAVGRTVLEAYPDMRTAAQVNRSFLRRSIHFLIAQGIDQFLDIGSGIPTVGNVHEVAQKLNPVARVVYVDIDPVAVLHSRAILQGNACATAIQADARQPEQILQHPEVKRLLDFDRPIGLLLVAVLHLVADDDQALHTVSTLRDALAPGSYVAISQTTFDGAPPGVEAQVTRLAAGASTAIGYRSYDRVRRMFDGLEVVEPGLVFIPLWRPEGPNDVFLDKPERALNYAGVGRKP